MGAYSKRQFARSDFDRTGYEFNETEGVGNYFGLPDIEVGTRIILEFKRSKQGKMRLNSVRAE